MKDHYSVLGVSPDATPKEVRRAYRREVKAAHPDLHNGAVQSVERIKELVAAWETLGNPHRRAEYDRLRGYCRREERQEFNYPDFLRQRRDDPRSQARLIFYDLLHDNPEEALQIYSVFLATGDFDLARYLDREDFMDCAFLLAEEYESREEYLRAFELFAAIVRFEQHKPYFRHFMADVFDHLRHVLCFRLPSMEDPDTVLSCLYQAVDWDFSRKDRAFLYRIAAEMCLKKADRRGALRNVQRGLSLDPRLAGVRKIQQELGLSHAL
ncbi:DnaJ domain-containing protein [Alkalispirochaeta americana]|uniref:DnaJ domain-containing protein n=1 Tax=Alkalispirochaeta americana TaxID=159291 RepID=A0A1N6P3H3_9SPIO|nr:J domain-containing protein [Alkalispirochaeta americana]SIP98948.1 DnaJ domain-containing protein [Alkalispirochaeta americana]